MLRSTPAGLLVAFYNGQRSPFQPFSAPHPRAVSPMLVGAHEARAFPLPPLMWQPVVV